MEGDLLKDFWTPFFAYWTLLGVELIFLGVGLAGLVLTLRRHDARERTDDLRPARGPAGAACPARDSGRAES